MPSAASKELGRLVRLGMLEEERPDGDRRVWYSRTDSRLWKIIEAAAEALELDLVFQRHVAVSARTTAVNGLQRGHGRGASPSKPSIRVTWSHSPHQGGRDGRARGGAGSSAGESRAASTAYGLRTPLVFAPVKAASACGVQPALRAVVTAGASLARWAAVSRQSATQRGEEVTDRPTAAGRVGRGRPSARAGGGGSVDGSCTVRVQPPHPVAAPVAPRRRWLHPVRLRGATAAPRRPSYPQPLRGGVR